MNPDCARKACTPLVAAAIALALAAPANTLAAGRKAQTQFDQFIVKFKDSSAEKSNPALRQRLLDGAGRHQGLRVGHLRRMSLGADVIRIDRKLDARATKDFIGRLRADPRVAYAEPDLRVYPAFTPNDPNYAQQWHYKDALAGINAPAAWDITNGAGQVVAVLDTGAVAHSDLAANLLPGYDFITDVPTAFDGNGRDNDPSDPGDFVAVNECDPEGGSNASDSSWHGTHVAGTIAAVTNNAKGVAGVAFGAKVVPLRVLGKCGGVSSDIADAIIWASGGVVPGVPANPHPARVINLSLGGRGACGVTTQNAIDTAVANSSTVVVAAGNYNSDASGVQPASCNNIITVAALARSGARASYSNFGAVIDIAAPGGGGGNAVWSTLNNGATVPGMENYEGYNGTSMAAPHVAGVAALAQAKAAGVMSPAQVESLLEVTARAQPEACPEGCGMGMLDAFAAVTGAGTTMLTLTGPGVVIEGDAGTQTLVYTVGLTAASGGPVTFDIATENGTASAGSDYVGMASLAQTIPAGQTTRTFTVTVNGDATAEPDETFAVRVTNANAPLLSALATTKIVNDDAIALANGVPVTGISGATNSQRLYRIDVPAGATNLQIGTTGSNGDLDLYTRFGALPTLSSFDCNYYTEFSTETCFFPTPQAGRHYILLHGYAAYSDVTLTASYSEAALPALSINDVSLNEGDSGSKLLTFTVTLSSASASPVSFRTTTVDGSAVGGPDFTSAVMVDQTIPAGQLSKAVSITIPGDVTVEPTEYFYLNLSNPVNATVADSQGIGYIINNDGALITINDIAVGEGNSGTKLMTFTVKLSQVAPGPVTYNIFSQNANATAGSDYVALNLTGQTIPQGQLAKTHSITINGDTTIEDTEVVLVNVRQPVGASVWDGQGIGYILNDDGPTLSIPDASSSEGASGTKVMNVTVLLSQVASVPVTFTLGSANVSATAGSDYVAFDASTVHTIPAGQTSKAFQVTVNGDTTVEQNESFTLTLGNATGATLYDRQAIATIYNDDGPTLAINNATISEGNAGTKLATFTVTLSQAAPNAISYNIATSNVTATAGSDYVAKSLVGETIPAGQRSKTFTVTINGDTTAEANETFRATLSNASAGATLFVFTGTGTITNDD